MPKRFVQGLQSGLTITLSATGISLARTGGWLRPRSVVLAERTWPEEDFSDPARMAPKLHAMLAEFQCQRMATRIVLSDALVRIWMVTPPQNLTRLADCMAATMLRFQALFGEPASGWEISTDIDARHPFAACAMPRALLQALIAIAAEHQLTLLEIAPQFVSGWNRYRADLGQASWFGALHDNILSIGATSRQRLKAVRIARLPDDACHDREWLFRHLKRESLRLDLPMPSRMEICGTVPAPWLLQSADGLQCTRLDAVSAVVGQRR